MLRKRLGLDMIGGLEFGMEGLVEDRDLIVTKSANPILGVIGKQASTEVSSLIVLININHHIALFCNRAQVKRPSCRLLYSWFLKFLSFIFSSFLSALFHDCSLQETERTDGYWNRCDKFKQGYECKGEKHCH